MKQVYKKDLIKGKKYLLRTHNNNGDRAEVKVWIETEYDGKNLIDSVGTYWNEWLYPILGESDIFEL